MTHAALRRLPPTCRARPRRRYLYTASVWSRPGAHRAERPRSHVKSAEVGMQVRTRKLRSQCEHGRPKRPSAPGIDGLEGGEDNQSQWMESHASSAHGALASKLGVVIEQTRSGGLKHTRAESARGPASFGVFGGVVAQARARGAGRYITCGHASGRGSSALTLTSCSSGGEKMWVAGISFAVENANTRCSAPGVSGQRRRLIRSRRQPRVGRASPSGHGSGVSLCRPSSRAAALLRPELFRARSRHRGYGSACFRSGEYWLGWHPNAPRLLCRW